MAKTDTSLFELYKQVQHKDPRAIKQLVAAHKKKYPNHHFHKKGYQTISQTEDLHLMYLHLTK